MKIVENKMMNKSTGEVSLTTLVVVLGTAIFMTLAMYILSGLGPMSMLPFDLLF